LKKALTDCHDINQYDTTLTIAVVRVEVTTPRRALSKLVATLESSHAGVISPANSQRKQKRNDSKHLRLLCSEGF
jgi:hypothetical protein